MKPVIRINLKAALGNIALVILGVGIALGLMELLLRTNPNLVPREVRVNPPVRRVRAFVDETYDVKLSDGDLYYWMQGTFAPLSPDKDKVVAHVNLTTNAHGFHNSLPEKATYGIVALGDSFVIDHGGLPRLMGSSPGILLLTSLLFCDRDALTKHEESAS